MVPKESGLYSLAEGVPTAVEACTFLVNFQRMTSCSFFYFHLKKMLPLQSF